MLDNDDIGTDFEKFLHHHTADAPITTDDVVVIELVYAPLHFAPPHKIMQMPINKHLRKRANNIGEIAHSEDDDG